MKPVGVCVCVCGWVCVCGRGWVDGVGWIGGVGGWVGGWVWLVWFSGSQAKKRKGGIAVYCRLCPVGGGGGGSDAWVATGPRRGTLTKALLPLYVVPKIISSAMELPF